MTLDNDTRRRWGLPVSRTDLDDEIAEELAYHLAQKQNRLEADGVEPTLARELALRRFGRVDTIHEECLAHSHRAENKRMRLQLLAEGLDDIKLALRTLRRRPVFAASAILTLALGIGATTAMYSLLDAVFVRALPYQQPERLVAPWSTVASQATFRGLAELDEFEETAAFFHDFATLTGTEEPARLPIAQVSPSFFRTLGVQPILGRGFFDADGETGAPETVVLSEEFWRDRMGGSRAAVGETIQLNGRPHEIVGVMPARLDLPTSETQLWIPFSLAHPRSGYYWGQTTLLLFARLKDGVTMDQAAAASRVAAENMRMENPIWRPDETFVQAVDVRPYQEALAGGVGDLVRLLFLGVLAVLLVVCVNVAGLFVSKAKAQEQEAAIRTSLGAGRGRLILQSLVEAWVVALLGTAVGLLLAFALLRWLPNALPGLDGQFGTVGLDFRVLGFALALSLITALAFGLLPALRASSTSDLSAAVRGLRGFSKGEGSGPILVVAQLALTVTLLSSAALLAAGVMDRLGVDTGIETDQTYAAALHPASADYADAEKTAQFYRRVLEELNSSPVVEHAAASTTLPFGTTYRTAFDAPDRNFDPNNLPGGPFRHITPGYFETMGISILRGRDLGPEDGYPEAGCTKETPCSALIDQTLADQIWPGEDALGRIIGADWQGWYRVVGIAADVPTSLFEDTPAPTIYFPQYQRPQLALQLVISSRAAKRDIEREVHRAVAAVDPQVPVTEIRTLRDDLWTSVATSRLAATLIGAFAISALLLAAVGIYGVMTYRTQQRRREMGIRLALGSTAGELRQRELFRVCMLALSGLAIGGALTFVGMRFLGAGRLLEVAAVERSLSPGIWLVTGLVLLGVALIAGYGPARRASTLDPSEVLGAE